MGRLTFVAWLATLLFGLSNGAIAQDYKHRYVGQSSCAPEIQSNRPDFSARLDKSRNTFLVSRSFSHVKVLMIVQFKGGNYKCGMILDAVTIRHLSKEFQFSCVDPLAPSDVVIGTRNGDDTSETGIAIEAWRVDLPKQAFEKASDKVSCTNESYAGSDDGSDMVDEAKKRTSR